MAMKSGYPLTRTLKPIALVLGVLVAAATLQPARATDVCGSVCEETWTAAGNPYVMTCDVNVGSGCTLTIESGVEVRSQPGSGLEVGGMLEVNGTSGAPVTFTSAASTLDWDGIAIYGSDSSTLDYATINYAHKAVWAGGDALITLNHVTAQYNARALYVEGYGLPSVAASDCTFTFNGSDTEYAIEVKRATGFPNPSLTINRSAIHDNVGTYDVYTANFTDLRYAVIDLRDNWWGETDPQAIDARIKDDDYSEFVGDPKVDWCGYLDGPGGSSHRGGICPELVICDETVVWDRTDEPYVLVPNRVHICPTGTLQIQPGVEFLVRPTEKDMGIYVEGTLEVNGTPDSPVTFQSDADTPSAGDWYGIELSHTPPPHPVCTVQNAKVFHAERAFTFDDGYLTLQGVTAQNNLKAVGCQSNLYPLELSATGCVFTGNEDIGIDFTSLGSEPVAVTITDSEIHSNGGEYDYAAGPFPAWIGTVHDLRGNWWGNDDAAEIASRVFSGSGVRVDWCGWLDGPPPTGSPARDAVCPELDICDETVIWSETSRPYLLTAGLEVCSTGTLQIDPGVEVLMVPVHEPSIHYIRGTLEVNGTAVSPVTFTSDGSIPQAGDWRSFFVLHGASLSIHHANIEYATAAFEAIDGECTIMLAGVTARFNNYALWITGRTSGSPVVTATGCAFTDNNDYGIFVSGDPNGLGNPSLTVTDSSIYGNLSTYDYYADTNFMNPETTTLDAQNNWWGTTDTAVIASRIHDHNDSPGSPTVDWCAYLDGPGGTAPDVTCPKMHICDETEIWSETSRPYMITSDVEVCPTGTLQVFPGVDVYVVRASPAVGFLIEGVLDVNGTVGAPVTFTSRSDTPEIADWSGIRLHPGSIGDIEHATITYGNYGIKMEESAQATLTGVTAQHNNYGLHIYGWAEPPEATVSGCTFTHNQHNGVYLQGYHNPDLTLTNNSIHSNLGSWDLYAIAYTDPDTTIQYARGNYWGSTEPMDIASRIYDYSDASGGPRVDWCGYLDAPGGIAVKDMHCPELVACDGTEIWDLTDKPYQITSTIYVCPTGTLQVEPGVEARAVATFPRPGIQVEGVLDINGTEASPMTLTSDADTPEIADWSGIRLHPGSIGDIEHATITYGNHGIKMEDSAQATLTGVTAQHNNYGLHVYGWAEPPEATVSGCTFTHNQHNGVYLQGDPNPNVTLTSSSIHSNLSSWDLYVIAYTDPDSTIVWATDNWWGTTDESAIGQRIWDHDDDIGAPHVYFRAVGEECDWALGADSDGDGLADFQDNCPTTSNAAQIDGDGDLMGDACDPEPSSAPSLACDGFEDLLDGYLDTDGDGWGDPCDHRPLRADSYPGAPELCDGRDNDGDALLDLSEMADEDLDENIACGDCDDLVAEVHVCACELCDNLVDDDCDLATDGDDTDCELHAYCILLQAGTEPWMTLEKGECGGAELSGPFDVVRGKLEQLQIVSGQVDLGQVECVVGGLNWDRVTEWAATPNPLCLDVTALYYLSKNSGDFDYGAASSGERRDLMDPDPACP